MIAKKRAIEIYNQFEKQIKFNCQPSTVSGMVKQCAIIHVKGIIEEHKRYFSNEYSEERLKYWKELLHELNKM